MSQDGARSWAGSRAKDRFSLIGIIACHLGRGARWLGELSRPQPGLNLY